MPSLSRSFAGAAVTVAVITFGLALSTSAAADTPSSPSAAFTAPACAGETDWTPSLVVNGDDLDAFNAGQTIALYDSWGDAPTYDVELDNGAFPALCGIRYLDEANGGPVGGGAVSAWMFCTDIERQVCNDGRPLDPEIDRNSDFTDFARSVFAYIVQHGHSYQPVGTYPLPTADSLVVSDTTSEQRNKLQYLLWCVSDYDTLSTDTFRAFCDANGLDPASLATEYAFLDGASDPVHELSASGTPFALGATAVMTLRTTIFESPIELSSAGPVTLCAGETDATLTGTTLVVAAGEPGTTVSVELCATSAVATTLSLTATGTPSNPDTMNWYHNGDDACQVYASFASTTAEHLTANTSVTFEAAADTKTTDTAAPGTTLAATGAATSTFALVVAPSLVLLGFLVVALTRRRHA